MGNICGRKGRDVRIIIPRKSRGSAISLRLVEDVDGQVFNYEAMFVCEGFSMLYVLQAQPATVLMEFE